MKLIMNADDYGYSKSINYGIIEAFHDGIVRSTTLMPNMPGFDHAVALAKANLGLGIGIHLTLTCGYSLTSGKTISAEGGKCLSSKEIKDKANSGQIDLAEIETEYRAQIKKVLDAGISPTHFDSHHHTHMLPGIVDVFLKLAAEFKVPVRMESPNDIPAECPVKTTEVFTVDFYNENATIPFLQDLLSKHAKAETMEVMCHPAFLDAAIMDGSSYNLPRIREYAVITSPEMKEYIKQHNITLTNFKSII